MPSPADRGELLHLLNGLDTELTQLEEAHVGLCTQLDPLARREESIAMISDKPQQGAEEPSGRSDISTRIVKAIDRTIALRRGLLRLSQGLDL